jgi:predicted RecB family nuclease
MQWRDAELALKVARHNYERWAAAGREDTPSPAIMHAYYTHEALDEAARAITTLIDTFRSEAAASPTTAAHTNIPTRHR